MTADVAARLNRTLVEKLRQRGPTMEVEAEIAVGLRQTPVGFECPPAWALSAARITSESVVAILPIPHGPGTVEAGHAGALVGMAKTWAAFLTTPTPEAQKLEEMTPGLAALRKSITELSQPGIALGEKVGDVIAKAPLTARERVEFAKGQFAGASEIADANGALHEKSKARVMACYFVWLYWKDLKFCNSVTDLRTFLDEFLPDGVTQKNLEKVCAEIGLHFRKRGRPKNPTAKKIT